MNTNGPGAMSMPGMLYVKNVPGAVVVVVTVVVGAIVVAVALVIAAAIAVVSVADEDITVVAAGVGSVRLRIRSSIFGLAACLELYARGCVCVCTWVCVSVCEINGRSGQ